MPMLARLIGLFRRRAPGAVPDGPLLRNYDEKLIRAEFKRRYLIEFAGYVGRDRVASAGAGANFLLMAGMLGGAAIAGPLGGFGASALALGLRWYLGRTGADRGRTAQVVDRLERDETGLDGVETWLDRHIDTLPAYLDRLDREEAELRRCRWLIDRINAAGSADGLGPEDRNLLRRCGYRKLTPPIARTLPLPPRVRLGNWHHSQLARALWRDIGRAGG
ncbi:MAG TPA: hypothetical protein VM689_04375 [Aliidongia sp.]|nr:hypothetical protein [Aliidongia sp.]